jgi:hypothetical protein
MCPPADTGLCRCQPVQSQRGPSYPSQASSAPFLFSEVISARLLRKGAENHFMLDVFAKRGCHIL